MKDLGLLEKIHPIGIVTLPTKVVKEVMTLGHTITFRKRPVIKYSGFQPKISYQEAMLQKARPEDR